MSDKPDAAQNRRMTDSLLYWEGFWLIFIVANVIIFGTDWTLVGFLLLIGLCSLVLPAGKALGLRIGPSIPSIIFIHVALLHFLESLVLGSTTRQEALAFFGVGAVASVVLSGAGWGWLVRDREDLLNFAFWIKHTLFYVVTVAALLVVMGLKSGYLWWMPHSNTSSCIILGSYGAARILAAFVWRGVQNMKSVVEDQDDPKL